MSLVGLRLDVIDLIRTEQSRVDLNKQEREGEELIVIFIIYYYWSIYLVVICGAVFQQ